MKRRRVLMLCVLIGASAVGAAVTAAQSEPRNSREEKRARRTEGERRRADRDGGGLAVPPELASLRQFNALLGRPTDRSIALSVLSTSEVTASVEYGTQSGAYSGKTQARSSNAGVPFEIEIGSLEPNTKYYYRLLTRTAGERAVQAGPEGTFHTQRAPGSTFTFALQGDSHPERDGKMYDASLYAQTMHNVAKDAPDFYLTIGDDFSIDRLIAQNTLSQPIVDRIYAHQRSFLGVVGRSSSLFLVNGNHEHGDRYLLDGTDKNAAVLAGRARLRYYPLPVPDDFYTGDTEQVQFVGLPRDYYAWTWGDALFVVIDFYWHSPVPVDHAVRANRRETGEGQSDNQDGGMKRDPWAATLGDVQYRWLAKTLTESKARWKFVFCHHVMGTGRGGIESASFFEWGGKDKHGASVFAQKRPGWPLPIHDLMVKTGVTIFFQGHDHIFARQDLDGVVYQSCPNPADSTYQAFNRDAYLSGDVLPNSGHLRVTVSSDKVGVDYVRAYLANDVTKEHPNAKIAHHYELPAAARPSLRSPHTRASSPQATVLTAQNPGRRQGQREGQRGGQRGPRGDDRPGANDQAKPGDQGRRGQPPKGDFRTDVPEHPFDVVLGRPSPSSVTASVLFYGHAEGCIFWGTASGDYSSRSPTRTFTKGEPAEVVVGPLKPDTAYFYQLRYHTASSTSIERAAEGRFHTPRAPGSPFVFTIQADPHLDEHTEPAIYRRTLENALTDHPDFHIDLGDTFMTEKHASRETAARQYLAQRYYFGLIGHSAPLFLVLGNHDGEGLRWHDGTADSMAVWSNTMRKRYFPNPLPGTFYSGNESKEPFTGLLEDYYAWEWGDALFVALDPFWYTPRPRGGDEDWKRTLGAAQYQWLKRTLEQSRATFKFVFIHHLVGGVSKNARGGVEAAPYFEWGGRNPDGSDGFREHRPGWPMPIHQLLVHNRVTAVFHGHDHLYVKQELDGIVYQEVPQPGAPGYNNTRTAAEYGYKSGVIQGSSGHLRVRVSPQQVTVDYVRVCLPESERPDRRNGQVGHSYWIQQK